MADMGVWSLGFVKKHCLLDERVGEGFVWFMSDWLTDVAFFFFFLLHLSTVNDQSFDTLDGYRMQTSSSPDKTQCSGYALVFTSHVHGLLWFSVRTPLLIYHSSHTGLHVGREVFKSAISRLQQEKKNQPLAMHLTLNKHFLLYSALTLSRP